MVNNELILSDLILNCSVLTWLRYVFIISGVGCCVTGVALLMVLTNFGCDCGTSSGITVVFFDIGLGLLTSCSPVHVFYDYTLKFYW